MVTFRYEIKKLVSLPGPEAEVIDNEKESERIFAGTLVQCEDYKKFLIETGEV